MDKTRSCRVAASARAGMLPKHSSLLKTLKVQYCGQELGVQAKTLASQRLHASK